ncbi:MAG TPA: NUDIX hydrolase [Candidatus Saccharimonadales bacterium]|nr:NUDIX hydrolase [Candidatus Saccharimonadales bacterium]
MRKASRAIIIEDGKILVMHRNKYGSQYYTLVGGRINDHETPEQALVREVREETGLQVTAATLVYIEEHSAPYNEQFIYVCSVAPHTDVAIQEDSEEGTMNRFDLNTHKPVWVSASAFAGISFRTPLLQQAMLKAFKKGFPKEPVKLQEEKAVIYRRLLKKFGKSRRKG